jgi:hypothetical protein
MEAPKCKQCGSRHWERVCPALAKGRKNAILRQQPPSGDEGLRTVPAMRAIDGNVGTDAATASRHTAGRRKPANDADPAMQGVPVENAGSDAKPKFDRTAYQRELMRKRRAEDKARKAKERQT